MVCSGVLRVLAVGPLTNLALALELEPALPSLVADVGVMGGAVAGPGNVTAVAEANIINAPVAAQAVFAAAWPVTMVGLDVTMEARFEEAHRAALEGGGASAQALAAMLGVYFDFYTAILGRPSCALGTVTPTHDPVVPIEVDTTDGPGRGQTIADLRDRYIGFPERSGLRHRVVLRVPEGFGEALVGSLLSLP